MTNDITSKSDHTWRNIIIILGMIVFFFSYIGSLVHYQMGTAVDCSLLTMPSNKAPIDSDIGLVLPGKNYTIAETRQMCFDSAQIKSYELCYYLPCGADINHTINYEFKPIQKSLAEPNKLHLYPNEGITP